MSDGQFVRFNQFQPAVTPNKECWPAAGTGTCILVVIATLNVVGVKMNANRILIF